MVMTTEAKVLAALESISATQLRITDSLSELVTVAKELVTVAKTNSKRQGTKDTKETLGAFLEDAKSMIQTIIAPQPLPAPTFTPPPMKHEVKVLHLDKYIHNQPQLEADLNKLVDENYILAGVTDYLMVLHRYKPIVDAEFTDDGGKIDVQ